MYIPYFRGRLGSLARAQGFNGPLALSFALWVVHGLLFGFWVFGLRDLRLGCLVFLLGFGFGFGVLSVALFSMKA